MDLTEALQGVLDTEEKLRQPGVESAPETLSTLMYTLGQYASALEKELGNLEEEYEREWASEYKEALTSLKLSATAAKQHADVENADVKGQIKRLTRFVNSAWKVHQQCMARWKHINNQDAGA